jgi:hypothetical protein
MIVPVNVKVLFGRVNVEKVPVVPDTPPELVKLAAESAPVNVGDSFAVRTGVVVGLATEMRLFEDVTEVTEPPPAAHAVLVDTMTPAEEERQSPEVRLPALRLVTAATVPGAMNVEGMLRTGLTPPEEVI